MDTVIDSETGLAVTQPASAPVAQGFQDLMPIGSVSEISQMFNQFKQFIADQLEEGVDLGTTPGVDKPFLWQPGAEKIAFFFGLGLDPVHVAAEVTPSYVSHTYKCRLISLRTGMVRATYEGSCNSAEKKIANMATAQGISDMRALDNNIRKRAQKRSIVSAVRSGTAASQYFHAKSAEHADDDEDENGNGHASVTKTKLCSIHNVVMHEAISAKTGKGYFGHKVDGKMCFGAPSDRETVQQAKPVATPAANGATQQRAPEGSTDSPEIPAGRGDRMNFVTDNMHRIKWTAADLTKHLKEVLMHGALSQCTDDELLSLCRMVITPLGGSETEAQA